MSMGMTRVRQATPEDLKVMVTLLKELFSIETDFTFNKTRQRAGLRGLLREPNAVVLVAERDNLIVGMCTVQTVISTAEGNRVGLLEDMVVHDKFRRQGIGRALLSAAEQWACEHKLSRLKLLADARNKPALGFYAAREWQPTNLVCWRKRVTKNRYTDTG